MKKLLLIIIVIFSFNVYADTCSKDELARLKNIANQVELTYEYEPMYTTMNNHKYLFLNFTIIATNVTKELKVNYETDFFNGDYEEFKVENGVGKLSGFEDGENATITIRAYTNNECSGKVLLNKTIKMPYLNPMYYYYNNCSDYPDFEYCQPVTEKKITNEFFLKEFYKYLGKTDKNIENNDTTIDEKNSNLVTISIIIASLLVLIVIITVIYKKRKKSRL